MSDKRAHIGHLPATEPDTGPDASQNAGPDTGPNAGARDYWLFSAPVDLSVFLGSALLALALLPLGGHLGVLYGDSPEWTWVFAVLIIDVAHVWSTTFRVYLDRDELAHRPWLYAMVPLVSWIVGVALYSEGAPLFWRVLAYMAVFHFVRQQFGWVVLYRARVGERDRWGRVHDSAVIYAATVFPLVYWHAHMPRAFWWFIPGDFAAVPTLVASLLEPLYWALMASYLVKMVYLWQRARAGRAPTADEPGARCNPGKDIVVVSTAVCWYVGIVALNSDYAFTVTNVIIHGVPYFALIYWYGRRRRQSGHGGPVLRVFFGDHGPWLFRPLLFLGALWLVAYAEELVWERAVWQERAWLFGDSWDLVSWHMFLVPLLAVPQVTHYILDGFIWKRRKNPGFQRAGGFVEHG